jgi:hypothetical protein
VASAASVEEPPAPPASAASVLWPNMKRA